MPYWWKIADCSRTNVLRPLNPKIKPDFSLNPFFEASSKIMYFHGFLPHLRRVLKSNSPSLNTDKNRIRIACYHWRNLIWSRQYGHRILVRNYENWELNVCYIVPRVVWSCRLGGVYGACSTGLVYVVYSSALPTELSSQMEEAITNFVRCPWKMNII